MSDRFPDVAVTTMSGAGNDFVVLDGDGRRRLGDRFVQWVKAICRRGLSVGADGVLVVERDGADRVLVEFRNPDGSIAFCGNGTRCAARFAARRGWIDREGVCITSVGEIFAVVGDESVTLRLPPPSDRGAVVIATSEGQFEGRWVLAGVSHLVILVVDVDDYPLATVAPPLRVHAKFGPDGTNVDVVAKMSDRRYRIRTWERGVEGETLACGSGAVAAAATMRQLGAPPALEIVPRSGIPLRVEIPDPVSSPPYAMLQGDARVVMEGVVGPGAIPFDAP